MRPAVKGALLGGFIAGTIDIGSAAAINSASPVVICRAIAVGVLGLRSFQEGANSALLGLFLQWGMAMIIALLYLGATALIPVLRARWPAGGMIGGIVTFLVMDYVVLPLSAVGHAPRFTLRRGAENLVAIILFVEIIAFVIHHFSHSSARN